MTYRLFRSFFLGIGLLTSLSVGAQTFESELQLSSDEVFYWYRICCAQPGMDDLAMTDYNGMTDLCVYYNKVFLLPTETEEFHSQWKLTAGEDGKVVITNRATGQQINSASVSMSDVNITELTYEPTPGFAITSLGDYAFKIESVERDGVNRCLALAEEKGGPLFYPEGDESSSIIGWKFYPVEIDTGIGYASAGAGQTVRVSGKRISVGGCTEWQLFNAQGEEMPRTISLPTGVYLVKTPQKSVKIFIP